MRGGGKFDTELPRGLRRSSRTPNRSWWRCSLGCSPPEGQSGKKKLLLIPPPHDPSKWIPKGILIWSSRVAHKLHFISQDLVKNTSLGGGLPVLQIKIPFGIHLLGSWGGGICSEFIFFPLWPSGGKQPNVWSQRKMNFYQKKDFHRTSRGVF